MPLFRQNVRSVPLKEELATSENRAQKKKTVVLAGC